MRQGTSFQRRDRHLRWTRKCGRMVNCRSRRLSWSHHVPNLVWFFFFFCLLQQGLVQRGWRGQPINWRTQCFRWKWSDFFFFKYCLGLYEEEILMNFVHVIRINYVFTINIFFIRNRCRFHLNYIIVLFSGDRGRPGKIKTHTPWGLNYINPYHIYLYLSFSYAIRQNTVTLISFCFILLFIFTLIIHSSFVF